MIGETSTSDQCRELLQELMRRKFCEVSKMFVERLDIEAVGRQPARKDFLVGVGGGRQLPHDRGAPAYAYQNLS